MPLEGKSNRSLFYADYSLSLLGLRDGCWEFIYQLESGRSKLFDLCADAAESTDLSSMHTECVAAYRTRFFGVGLDAEGVDHRREQSIIEITRHTYRSRLIALVRVHFSMFGQGRHFSI